MNWSEFAVCLECVTRLRATNSSNEKKSILEEYKENRVVRNLFYFTYNPLLKYKITKSGLDKAVASPNNAEDISPFVLCSELAVSNINTQLRNKVKSYIAFSVPSDYRDLVRGMLLKDLGVRMDAKSINKAIPNLIPTFDVALANPIKKKDSKTGEYKWVSFKRNEWISVSLKLNGVRCACIGSKFHTRTGHEINGMTHIKNELFLLCEEMGVEFKNVVFDGELIRENRNMSIPDEDNFRLTCSIVNSDDRSELAERSLEYVIFDFMTTDEFSLGESLSSYKARSAMLKEIGEVITRKGLKHVRIVPIYYQGAFSKEVIDKCLEETDRLGLEGVMVNRDATYQAKRTNNLLKVKSWFFNDLTVLDIYEGEGDFEGMLGGITVNYKGNKVNCGSGMNQEFREYYWKHKDELIGKIITVKCKGESRNKDDDSLSMQFPIFMCIREDKNEESYES